MDISRSTRRLVPVPADNFQQPTASCHGDVGKPQYGQVVKIKVKDPWRIRTESLGESTVDAAHCADEELQVSASRSAPAAPENDGSGSLKSTR